MYAIPEMGRRINDGISSLAFRMIEGTALTIDMSRTLPRLFHGNNSETPVSSSFLMRTNAIVLERTIPLRVTSTAPIRLNLLRNQPMNARTRASLLILMMNSHRFSANVRSTPSV